MVLLLKGEMTGKEYKSPKGGATGVGSVVQLFYFVDPVPVT